MRRGILDAGYWVLDTGRRYRVSNLMLRALRSALFALCLLLLVAIFAGCGEETSFEAEDSVPPDYSSSLSALNFPTTDGSSWKYVLVDGDHAYTAEVVGTRNVGGFATRVMENDSEVPADQIASLYGVPISTSFFTKDLDSYTEHAFELWVSASDSAYFQRNLPKLKFWSFPLQAGKEWIVSKSRVLPEITYSRKVISDDGALTVPAGTFTGVYYVEEYATIAGLENGEEPPQSSNRYWLASDVGIIKYEYLDYSANTTRTYELSVFRKGR